MINSKAEELKARTKQFALDVLSFRRTLPANRRYIYTTKPISSRRSLQPRTLQSVGVSRNEVQSEISRRRTQPQIDNLCFPFIQRQRRRAASNALEKIRVA